LAREVQERDRAIVIGAPEGILVVDAESRAFHYANPAACSLFGYAEEEWTRMTIRDIHPAEFLPQVIDAFEHRARVEQLLARDIPCRRRDGSVFFADINSRPLTIAGRPMVVAFFTDIAERRRAEAALLESEQRFRLAVEATTDGLWDWELGTDGGYFSPGYYRMLGYEPDEFRMSGRAWLDRIHPEDRERALRANTECIENRTPCFEVEFRMRTRSGGYKWILGRGQAAARDACGRATRMIGTHVDITERKRAEEALQESEARFRALTENSLMGVCVAEEDGFRYANPALAAMIGYSPEEIRGLRPLELIHPDDRPKAMDMARRRLSSTAESVRYVCRLVCKSGKVIDVETMGRGILHQGRPAIMSTIQDITERRRAEEDLRKSREAHVKLSQNQQKLLEEERSRLSTHLHDELGQSLTFLMLQLAYMERRVQGADPELQQALKEASEQAREMIANVRAVARSLRPIAIEHDGLIPSLKTLVQDFQRLSGIRCRLSIRLGDLVVSEELATTLYRLVQEALTNIARHAGAGRSAVTVAAAGGAIELRIQDDGQGADIEALRGLASLGIIGMKERAAAVGGRLSVARGSKGGVVVKARFPLPDPAGGDPDHG
jgi:PAS domain S-box-containing protein